MSYDWVGGLIVLLATMVLGSVVTWFAVKRSPAVAVAGLLICLSSGVMLWMLSDFVTDPSYGVLESPEDWLWWSLFEIANISALAILSYSVWRFNHKALVVAAVLSSVSILFPVGILAGIIAWWGYRNDVRIGMNVREDELPYRQKEGKVDVAKIAQLMEAGGFKNVTMASEYEGFQFQIVAEGKIGLQKLPTLVKAPGTLDEIAARRIAEEFISMNMKKSSYFIGTFFLYCVIAERIEESAVKWLLGNIGGETQGFGPAMKGGGGHLLIADAASGRFQLKKIREGISNHEIKMVEILVQMGIIRG